MTYDNEAIVRHAYHTAEGDVLDVAGFVGSFANDGVINLGHAGIEASGVGQESYRGEHLGELVLRIAKTFRIWVLRGSQIEFVHSVRSESYASATARRRLVGATTNPTTAASGHAIDRTSNVCQCGSRLGLKSRKFCSITS